MAYITLKDNYNNPIEAYRLNLANPLILDGTSAAATSSAFATRTAVVLHAAEDFHVVTGTAPTATTSNLLIKGGTFFPTQIKGGDKISIIKASAATGGKVAIIDILNEDTI